MTENTHSSTPEYLVRIGDDEIPVNPSDLDADIRLDQIRGSRYLFHYRGRTIPLVIRSNGGRGVSLTTRHRTYEGVVLDHRHQLLAELGLESGQATAATELKAPMPGLVLKIHVHRGDSVSKGDPLLVLEAMKMENELRAEGDAIVESVEVCAGEAVTKNSILIRFAVEDSES